MDLRVLRESDKKAFDQAYTGFQRSNPDWEFAFDYETTMEFPKFLARLDELASGFNLNANQVPSTYLVAVVDGEIVGRVSIRHELNDGLRLSGGHIGYGVVENWRRKGIASEILRQALDYVRELGLTRVLLTCEDNNIGSYKVIEKHGGILEGIYPLNGITTRRYWIEL